MSWTATEAIERLEHLQDRLNACTLIDRRAAVNQPREGPLSGMPIVIKDLIDHAGRPTTCGSGFYRQTAPANATVVDRLEAAGAVIVGRAGLHEWAYGFSSENHWFGAIHNPWDTNTSPGGSSGGSAVAVAAGLVPASIGTDTGGSIRVPAALTGVYGLKVTFGRVPTDGVFPLAPSLDTVGPLAVDPVTLARVYRVIAGTSPEEPAEGLTGLRIGIPVGWMAKAPAEPGALSWFGAVREALDSEGAVIVEVDEPRLEPWGMSAELAGAEIAYIHRPFRREGCPYGPEVAARLETAEQVSPEDYQKAQQWRTRLVEAFSSVYNRVDLLVTPALAARRKVIGQDLINGQHYRPVLSWFSALVNHAGIPAITVPLTIGTVDSLPPPSLQLMAPWRQEERLLGVAARLEQIGLAGFTPPPIHVG
ncbi:MAG: amidase [Actinomycetota bacterium]